jgi:hypothetical protein
MKEPKVDNWNQIVIDGGGYQWRNSNIFPDEWICYDGPHQSLKWKKLQKAHGPMRVYKLIKEGK